MKLLKKFSGKQNKKIKHKPKTNSNAKINFRKIALSFFVFYLFFSIYSFIELESEMKKLSLFEEVSDALIENLSDKEMSNGHNLHRNEYSRILRIDVDKLNTKIDLNAKEIFLFNLLENVNFKVKTVSLKKPSSHFEKIIYTGAIETADQENYNYSPENFVFLEIDPQTKMVRGEVRSEGQPIYIKSLGPNLVETIAIKKELKELDEIEDLEDNLKDSITNSNLNAAKTKIDYLLVKSNKFSQAKREDETLSPPNVQNSNIIDIIMLYTEGANKNFKALKNNLGSVTPTIKEEMLYELSLVNHYLALSGVKARLRPVFLDQIDFDESGSGSLDLLKITLNEKGSDPKLSQKIQSLREQYGADLVNIWVGKSDLCGIAWAQTIPDEKRYGLSMKKVGCDSLTLAHEIGHNFGLGHDRFVEHEGENDYLADFGKGYGYIDLTGQFRTIMSYEDKCRYYGIPCKRISLYSSPYNQFEGRVIGALGTADAVTVMNANTPMITSYYPSKVPFTKSLNDSYEEERYTQNLNIKNDKLFKPCFVATFAYEGDSLHPHLNQLRHFRDHFLVKIPFGLGKMFIRQYYNLAPKIVPLIPRNYITTKLTKILLSPLIFTIKYPFILLSILFIFIAQLTFRNPKKFLILPLFFLSLSSQAGIQKSDPFSVPFLPTEITLKNKVEPFSPFVGIGVQRGEFEERIERFQTEKSKSDYGLPIVYQIKSKNNLHHFKFNLAPYSYSETENKENKISIINKRSETFLNSNYSYLISDSLSFGLNHDFNYIRDIKENPEKRESFSDYQRHEQNNFYQSLTPALSYSISNFTLMAGPSFHYYFSSYHVPHPFMSEKIALSFYHPFVSNNLTIKILGGIEHIPQNRRVADNERRGHDIEEANPYFFEGEITIDSFSAKYQNKKNQLKNSNNTRTLENIYAITFSDDSSKKPFIFKTEYKELKREDGINKQKRSDLALYFGKFY